MIFEKDFRQTVPALVGLAHFSVPVSRVFGILSDPSSWGQVKKPRVSSSSPQSKLVLTFDDYERATIYFNSWNSDFCQIEVVLDGFQDEQALENSKDYWFVVWEMLTQRLGKRLAVIASSPSKVNVYFAVGSFLKNGFHEVASCYQALSLREILAIELDGRFSIGFAGPMAEECKRTVPTDNSNLVFKAGLQLGKLNASVNPELVSFTIHKSVPVAGGMAGGSADGAASLAGLNELFAAGLEKQLPKVAAKLGSDVPFALAGGTAIGTGRGEKLTPIQSDAILHWVMTPSKAGLSTPDVYRKLDVLRVEAGVDVSKLDKPSVPEELVSALLSGDAELVAKFMHNDLEIAALAIRPELANTIEAGRKAGSLKSMVSGSGPTIAHLAQNRVHAEQVANRLTLAGFPSLVTHTSLTGTRLEN